RRTVSALRIAKITCSSPFQTTSYSGIPHWIRIRDTAIDHYKPASCYITCWLFYYISLARFATQNVHMQITLKQFNRVRNEAGINCPFTERHPIIYVSFIAIKKTIYSNEKE